MDDKKRQDDETRKLTLAIIFMSALVAMLFGLGPLI